VSDTTMAASGTTKKISINNVLGCSGTATLASATISGDLTVDTSTLKVDSTNNRVGIGTATPARPLDIVGSFQSTLGWVLTGTPAGLGAATRYIGGASTTDSWYYNAVSGGSHVWAFGESESMRLNSTGLGVGASPSYKFHVAGAPAATSGSLIFVRDTTANGSNTSLGSVVFASSPGTDFYVGKKSVNFATSLSIGNANTGVEYFQIDTSGNLGIGVTPSAWVSYQKSIDFGGAGNYGSVSARANFAAFATNCYFDGTNWIYKNTNPANLYEQSAGANIWRTAPSGTAGTAISFTQAMTLDASGNLGIGVTSPAAKLHVEGSGPQARFSVATAVDARHEYYRNGIREGLLYWDANLIGLYATQSSGELVLASANTIRVRINSAGDTISNVTATPPTLSTNRQMVFNLTSDTNLRISVRGTDGTTRTANITLA
jgi:hypothetical protein